MKYVNAIACAGALYCTVRYFRQDDIGMTLLFLVLAIFNFLVCFIKVD